MFYMLYARELAIKIESQKFGFFNDMYESSIQGKQQQHNNNNK